MINTLYYKIQYKILLKYNFKMRTDVMVATHRRPLSTRAIRLRVWSFLISSRNVLITLQTNNMKPLSFGSLLFAPVRSHFFFHYYFFSEPVALFFLLTFISGKIFFQVILTLLQPIFYGIFGSFSNE